MLDARIPSGTLGDKWTRFQETCPLVSPNNKRKHTVLIVGTGLANGQVSWKRVHLSPSVPEGIRA
ncbi:MAG: hypothetical protein AAFO87_12785, partial [Cyanobacteria bacterium J06607_6]